MNRAATKSFLADLWAPIEEGFIEIRILPAANAVDRYPRQQWFRSIDDAVGFLDEYSSENSGAGVYFGVAKRRRRGGSKTDILGVSSLWADIDTENNGWDTDRCVQKLEGLPDHVKPSALIHSGGGLHAYWFLQDRLLAKTHTADVEAANGAVARFVGGDNVGNIDRILRMPGTWNTKRGPAKAALCKILFCHQFRRFDSDVLVAAIGPRPPLFGPRNNLRSKHHSAMTTLQTLPPMALDELWSKRVRYHPPPGYIGVNEAITRTVAKLYCVGWRGEEIVDAVLKRVRRVQESQAPYESWDWGAEKELIQKSLDRWKKKCEASLKRSRL